LTPERFAPGIVSTDAIELNGVFSPDGREFYFTRVVDGVDTMYQIVFAGGKWGSPRELLLLPNQARAESADMVLSRDGQELYFLAKFTHAPAPAKPSYDIWRSRRAKDGWSQAELVPAPISTDANELYPVIGPDGSLYINSDRDGTGAIYRAARLADGTFAPPVNAGPPFAPRDGDLSIAPDGSFIVVSAQRPRVGGTYKNDLFVSFRQADGTWAGFVKLDDTVNTPAHEWCPMVTPDGRYLFFSRRFGAYDKEGWEGTTDGDVYWMDVRALDKYRPAKR
jgi:Tol biopolymer transport system component